ncbi:hypothetical protein [Chryseobacterium wanjuense]
MKKHILLVSTLAISLVSAQSNDELMRNFEKQKNQNNEKFDSYVSKHYGTLRTPEITKEIEEKRSNLAGFDPSGKPFFYATEDLDQIKIPILITCKMAPFQDYQVLLMERILNILYLTAVEPSVDIFFSIMHPTE